MIDHEENDSTFNPSRFLTKVSGQDYLEVKWRLLWLRTEHPGATIDTTCLSYDERHASFKATVSIPFAGSASGHGSETPNDFKDYYEKAETKAIGRALAALGYGTQFSKDYEFESEGGRIVDAPVGMPAPRPQQAPGGTQPYQPAPPTTQGQQRPQASPNKAISDKQMSMIWGRAKDKGWDDINVHAYIFDEFHKESLSDLSSAEASKLIDVLMNPSTPRTYPWSEPPY